MPVGMGFFSFVKERRSAPRNGPPMVGRKGKPSKGTRKDRRLKRNRRRK